MKLTRIRICTCAVLVLTLQLNSFAQSSAHKSDSPSKTKSSATKSADNDFKQLINRYYDAWNTGKPDNAAPFYAKDPGLVFFDMTPLKYNGWDEYEQGAQRNLFDNMTEGKLTPNDDLKVTRRGSVAWTTLTFHYGFKMKDGKNLEGDGRHTAIWEKRGGKWLIVHEQLSAPMQ